MLRSPCLIWLALALSVPLAAAAVQEEQTVFCSVLRVDVQDGVRVLALDRGADYGLVEGVRGEARPVSRKPGLGEVVAQVVIVSVDAHVATARLVDSPASHPDRVEAGSVVEIPVMVAPGTYRGALHRVVTVEIELLDNQRAPIYSAHAIFHATDVSTEDAALARFADVGREVIRFTTGMTVPVPRPRFEGRTVSEILQQGNPEDYRAFLRFVGDYPGRYIGQSWKLSEVYATWLTNGAPPAHVDFEAELHGRTGQALTDAVLRPKDAEFASFVDWVVIDLDRPAVSPYGDRQARLLWLSGIVTMRQTPVPGIEARLLVARANAPGLSFRERARLFEEACKAHVRAGDTLESLIDLNNRGNALRDGEAFDAALTAFAEVQRGARAAFTAAKDPQAAVQFVVREAYAAEQRAEIFKRRGDHAAIVRELEPLAEAYGNAVHLGARAQQIGLLQRIATARSTLGDDAGAVALLERTVGIAGSMQDVARQVDLVCAIGDAHWSRSRWSDALLAYDRAIVTARAATLDRGLARALASSAQALWQLGRLKEALERHDEGLTLRRQLKDDAGLAWQLVEAGRLRVAMGDGDKAVTWFEEARRLRLALGQRSDAAAIDLELGELFLTRSDVDRARAAFRSAEDMATELGLVPSAAQAAHGLARAALQAHDFDAALAAARDSVTRSHTIKDPVSEARARVLLGNVLRSRADRPGSRREYLDAARLGAKDSIVVASAAVGLAGLDLELGQLDSAAKHARKAKDTAIAANAPATTVSALGTVSSVASARGDFAAALAALSDALTLARSSGNRLQLVDVLSRRAWAYADLGMLTEGRADANEGLEVARSVGDKVLEGWIENTLGRVAREFGDKVEERQHYDAALALMKAGGSRLGEASLMLNRGIVLAEVQDNDAALASFDAARALAGELADADFRLLLDEERAEALAHKADFAAAESGFNAAIAAARRMSPSRVAGFLGRLGQTQLQAGRPAAALTTFQEAAARDKAASPRLYTAEGWVGVALSRLGRDAEAITTITRALGRAEAAGAEPAWQLLAELGAIQDRIGDPKRALVTLQRAVAQIEHTAGLLATEAARERFHADKLDVFRRLVKLLLGAGRVDDALIYLERAKASELRDFDRKAGPRSGGDASDALAAELEVQEGRLQALLDEALAQSQPNREKIERLDGLLQAARRRRATFVESLDRDNGLFDRYSVRPLRLEALQSRMPEGALLVSPLVLDGRIVVFAVTRTAMTHFVSDEPSGGLDAVITRLRKNLRVETAEARGATGLAEVRRDAEDLYNRLLRQAFQALGTPERLVVSASGALRYIPFAALHDGKRWVVEVTTVSYATALDQEKFAADDASAPPSTLLALADPDGTLPGARLEVAAVHQLFGKSDVVEGDAATLASLRAMARSPGYDIVHFATHGVLDALHPEDSRVLLAGAPLTYADIPTLNLSRTRLVVLSACDTAAQAGGTGVEIAGLAYQFQRTRVGSVLATLWPVDDVATSTVIQAFYGRVQAGDSYASALAQAQRGLIAGPDETVHHPAFWGPFILMGRP